MLEQRPVSSLVRQQLDAQLRTDADFDAFCLDCFQTVYRRFGKGMERTEKVNLLLSLEEPSVVATQLRAWGLKPRTGTFGQSWRWLVVALVLLGGLTTGALYLAVSRFSPDVKPSPGVTPPVVTTPPAVTTPRATSAQPASGTNSGNAIVDSPEAQMKNRATGAAKPSGPVNSDNRIEGSRGATMTNESN